FIPRRPPPSPLFPYTTLFRSLRTAVTLVRESCDEQRERLRVTGDPQGPSVHGIEPHVADQLSRHGFGALVVAAVYQTRSAGLARSEEHTSELQSLAYLVCRLL